jgi:hypothetical protein
VMAGKTTTVRVLPIAHSIVDKAIQGYLAV